MIQDRYDYQKNLLLIREALRRNDTNSVIVEVLKFLNNPFSIVSDENTKYYHEFMSLINSERQEQFRPIWGIFVDKLRSIEEYKIRLDKIEAHNKRIVPQGEMLSLLCDVWDRLHVQKTYRPECKFTSQKMNESRGKQVEFLQFRIVISGNENLPLYPCEFHYLLGIRSVDLHIRKYYVDFGNPSDETNLPSIKGDWYEGSSNFARFPREYPLIEDALTYERDFILAQWQTFLEEQEKERRNQIAQLEYDLKRLKQGWLGKSFPEPDLDLDLDD